MSDHDEARKVAKAIAELAGDVWEHGGLNQDVAGALLPLLLSFADRARGQERERAAKLALNPYGNEVQAYGGNEPMEVGRKIAQAIRRGAHRDGWAPCCQDGSCK